MTEQGDDNDDNEHETNSSSFETSAIPSQDRSFQSHLLHAITVLLKCLYKLCSAEEIQDGSEYLLTDLTVCDIEWWNEQS